MCRSQFLLCIRVNRSLCSKGHNPSHPTESEKATEIKNAKSIAITLKKRPGWGKALQVLVLFDVVFTGWCCRSTTPGILNPHPISTFHPYNDVCRLHYYGSLIVNHELNVGASCLQGHKFCLVYSVDITMPKLCLYEVSSLNGEGKHIVGTLSYKPEDSYADARLNMERMGYFDFAYDFVD